MLPFILLQLATPQAADARLNLVCLGAGSAREVTSTSVYGGNSYGGSAWANVVGQRDVPFDDQVNLWIDGDSGKIRLPRTMLPKIHGGDAGWFELRNVKETDDTITGEAAVNFMNHPQVHLDRITGTISIDGKSGHYSGTCQKYDPASAPKRF